MSEAEVQVESWFKVELICLLGELKKNGAVRSWDRECPTGKGQEKMDFKIDLANTTGAVEVKTALGLQKGKIWETKELRDGRRRSEGGGHSCAQPLPRGLRISCSSEERLGRYADCSPQESSAGSC